MPKKFTYPFFNKVLLTTYLLKVRESQNEFMISSIFQITKAKIWRISALKVDLKFDQKLVLITLSDHPISRDI